MFTSLLDNLSKKILDNDKQFVLTLSDPLGDTAIDEKKCVVRVIHNDEIPFLQKQVFTDKKHYSDKPKHFTPESLNEVLETVLKKPYKRVHLQTPSADFYAKATIKRETTPRILTNTTKPSIKKWSIMEHDNSRHYPITPENSKDILFALGITDKENNIIASKRDKYKQINHFILIFETLSSVKESDGTLVIADCGCGKAYLSFTLYHYLRFIKERDVILHGIDSNKEIIDFCTKTAENLQYDTAYFYCSSLENLTFEGDCDIVLALHACDTATDYALAFAVNHKAKAILAAPCCHHYINKTISDKDSPDSFTMLLKDGITRERLADLITDSMRRDILIGHGYTAQLIEFVSPEHTTKNIMIRAEKAVNEVEEKDMDAFLREREAWKVQPKLAELLQI